MLNIQKVMVDVLGEVVAAKDCRLKARQICVLAEQFSDRVLNFYDVPKEPERRSPNELVKDFGNDLQIGAEIPEDIFRSLELLNVPVLFDAQEGWHEPEFDMLFGEDRVLLYHHPSQQIVRKMVYEEAAIFVVCWIAEALLRAFRTKEWGEEELAAF